MMSDPDQTTPSPNDPLPQPSGDISMEEPSSKAVPAAEPVTTNPPSTSTFSTSIVAAAAASVNTPASLAALLATALTDVDALREELAITRQRAERAERLLKTFGLVNTSLAEVQDGEHKHAPNGTDAASSPLPQATANLLLALDERTVTAERERDELAARLTTLTSNWSQLETYMGAVEAGVREARRNYGRVVRDEGGEAAYDYSRGSVPPISFTRVNEGKRTRTDSMFSLDGYGSSIKRSRPDVDYEYPISHSRRNTYVAPSHPHRHLPSLNHHHHHHHTLDRQATLPVHPPANSSSLAARDTYPDHTHRSPARQATYPAQRSRSRSRSMSAGGSEELEAMLLDSATGNARREKERGSTLENRAHTMPAIPSGQPFPARNAQNQRLCRQCGLPGRYKDGRCVEKWGPGPMGPGTVCDRCRKRAKRVERRGTGPTLSSGDIAIPPINYMQPERESSIRSSLTANRTLSVPASGGTSNATTPQAAPHILPPLRTHSPLEGDTDGDGLLDGDAEAEVDELEEAVDGTEVVVTSSPKKKDIIKDDPEGDVDLDMDLLEAVDASEKASR